MNVENTRTEYKAIINDKFEKTIVGFLNSKEGGVFYTSGGFKQRRFL